MNTKEKKGSLELRASLIHGTGIFTNETIKEQTKLGTGIYFKLLVFPIVTHDLGIWINHQKNSNSYLKFEDSKYEVYSKKLIKKNQEITLNYHDTPWFIQKPSKFFKEN